MMNSNMFPLIALAVLAAVIIVALLVTRRVRTRVKGFFGTLDMDASSPGIDVSRMTSQEGGFRAHDHTGGGARVDRVTTKKDIEISSSMPGEDPDPKARPPAKDRGR